MASDIDVEGGFTFTWVVENYSFCLEQVEECIKSPSFLTYPLDKFEWWLQLYPSGIEDGEELSTVSAALVSARRWAGNRIYPVNCKIWLLAEDGSPTVSGSAVNKIVYRSKYYGVSWFIDRGVLFGEKKELYVPRDTLTLRCRIWSMDENFSDDGSVSYGRTRIGVERKAFHWAIKKFCALQPLQRSTTLLHALSEQAPNMRMDLFSDEDRIVIEVIHADQHRRVKIACKISVLDSSGKVFESGEGEHVFESSARNLMWQFPTFLTKSRLTERRSTLLPNDVLHLRCECTLSGFVVSNVMEMDAFTDPAPHPPPASTSARPLDFPVVRDLKRMFEDGVLSDLNIRTKLKDFHVHRAVLAARSPVFRAIFDIDTSDRGVSAARSSIFRKVYEIVDVPDVDADVMHVLLNYIYSDEVVEACRSLQAAAKLYRAAGKYRIVPLRDRCADVLKSCLSVTNACDILALADAYEDQDLKSNVREFMFVHDREIIGTDQWKTFEKDHNLLSVETLREL